MRKDVLDEYLWLFSQPWFFRGAPPTFYLRAREIGGTLTTEESEYVTRWLENRRNRKKVAEYEEDIAG